MPITAQGALLPRAFLPGAPLTEGRCGQRASQTCPRSCVPKQPSCSSLSLMPGSVGPSQAPTLASPAVGGGGCGTVGGEAAWWAASTLGARKALASGPFPHPPAAIQLPLLGLEGQRCLVQHSQQVPRGACV